MCKNLLFIAISDLIYIQLKYCLFCNVNKTYTINTVSTLMLAILFIHNIIFYV